MLPRLLGYGSTSRVSRFSQGHQGPTNPKSKSDLDMRREAYPGITQSVHSMSRQVLHGLLGLDVPSEKGQPIAHSACRRAYLALLTIDPFSPMLPRSRINRRGGKRMAGTKKPTKKKAAKGGKKKG